jgi:anti-sigma factor RsiW
VSNDADTYDRLDAAYLLGALDADERLAYEAHLAAGDERPENRHPGP